VDPTGLENTSSQCTWIRKLLAYEKKYGTRATIEKYDRTWGSDPMPEELFDNKPIECGAGVIDLDWWSTLLWADANYVNVTGVYYIGKCIWNIKRKKWVAPYADPKERATVAAIANGYIHFYDLFSADVMAKVCPDKSKKPKPKKPSRPAPKK
jgi:hypothetical protein